MAAQLPPGVPLSQIPAAEPPRGVRSDFINPPSLYPLVVGICSATLALTLFFVVTRTYMAFRTKHKLAIDDYCAIIATILSFSYIGLLLSQERIYRHSWDTPLSFYDEPFFKMSFAQDIMLGPSIFFAKISLLLLYLRIFGLKQPVRYAIYFGLVFAFCLYCVTIPFSAYYCSPRPGKKWDLQELGGWSKCGMLRILAVVQAPLNVLLDLFIFILPLPIVMGLQMSARKKIAVLTVFLTGFLAIVASVVALVYRVLLNKDTDLWNSAIVYICIVVENNISIICGSMPAFASFSRNRVATSKFIVALRGCLKPHRAESKSKLFSSSKPCPRLETIDLGENALNGFSRLHVGQYAELGEDSKSYNTSFPSVTTRIQATARGDLEEGTIMESLSMEQSTKKKHTLE